MGKNASRPRTDGYAHAIAAQEAIATSNQRASQQTHMSDLA